MPHRTRAAYAALSGPRTGRQSQPAGRAPAQFADLLGITANALQMWPPLYVRSIFGSPRTWLPPYRRFSEYSLLDLWRPLRALNYMRDTWVPSIPRTPPSFSPPFCTDLFWQPTVVLQRPDHNGSYTTFPEEQWILINGIMTNDAVAQLNAALLAEIFHRPITLIQNSTNSLFVDLYQCALDKQGWHITEAATKAFAVVYDALKSSHKETVVLIAHSQGTIIAAAVLGLLQAIVEVPTEKGPLPAAAFAPPEFIYPDESPLELADFVPLTMAELAKLEIYCFATCATVMRHAQETKSMGRPVPHMEHFGNERDIVARLGMQAPEGAEHGVVLDGQRYVRPNAWGHLLNQHYLYPLAGEQRKGRRRGGRGTSAPFVPLIAGSGEPAPVPRLFDYINGGCPPRG